MVENTTNPPYPTDSGPAAAAESPLANQYSPKTVFDDVLHSLEASSPALEVLAHSMSKPEKTATGLIMTIAQILGDIWLAVLRTLIPLDKAYLDSFELLHEDELQYGVPAARKLLGEQLGVVQGALGANHAQDFSIPETGTSIGAKDIFDTLIFPFTLIQATADIRKPGSGFVNQKYLLKRALELNLAEQTVDTLARVVGFGWIAQIKPLLEFIDRSINPANVVREAMEQAYSFLMKAPMQRDMNRQHPVKDLGVHALAKLRTRGAISDGEYFERALDSGLNNEQAVELIVETSKLLSNSEIADLVNRGYIEEADAVQQLNWHGYSDYQARSVLFLETHKRYFAFQERVGTEAVTAWKHGDIDQGHLESMLQNLGFNEDEIKLLELEGQFVKKTIKTKKLSYSNVRDAFKDNLVDLDYVINYLQQDGYSQDDMRILVLLDFVKAEERDLKNAELMARIRVQEAEALELATKEEKKGETDLAKAKRDLAAELNTYEKQAGQLQSLPSIMSLLGVSL